MLFEIIKLISNEVLELIWIYSSCHLCRNSGDSNTVRCGELFGG